MGHSELTAIGLWSLCHRNHNMYIYYNDTQKKDCCCGNEERLVLLLLTVWHHVLQAMGKHNGQVGGKEPFVLVVVQWLPHTP